MYSKLNDDSNPLISVSGMNKLTNYQLITLVPQRKQGTNTHTIEKYTPTICPQTYDSEAHQNALEQIFSRNVLEFTY